MDVQRITKDIGRQVFGLDPFGYHNSRPDYPEWVYQMLRSRCGLTQGTATFEVGAGTGKATRSLLDLGADPLIAIEPDVRLAEFLRTGNPHRALNVFVSTFEHVELKKHGFDLGISATAFHWLEEDVALSKIARLLRPGGWWATFWNVFGDDSRPDPFHEATKKLLGEHDSPSVGEHGIPFGLDVDARLAALKRTDAFDMVDCWTSAWSLILNADQVSALYGTYSNINVRPDREEVLTELAHIARRQFGDRVTRNMTTSLYIARREA